MDIIKQILFEYKKINCPWCGKKILVKKNETNTLKKFCSFTCIAKYDQYQKTINL